MGLWSIFLSLCLLCHMNMGPTTGLVWFLLRNQDLSCRNSILSLVDSEIPGNEGWKSVDITE